MFNENNGSIFFALVIVVMFAAFGAYTVYYLTTSSLFSESVHKTLLQNEILDMQMKAANQKNATHAPTAPTSPPASSGTSAPVSSTPAISAPASTPVAVSTSTWKTYRNTKYGFKFQYPPDHTPYVSVGPNGLVAATSQSESVSVAEDTGGPASDMGPVFTVRVSAVDMRMSDWLDQNLKDYVPQPENTVRATSTFAGDRAVEVASSAPGALGAYRLVVVQPGNYFIVIKESAESALLDKIISTFSFNP